MEAMAEKKREKDRYSNELGYVPVTLIESPEANRKGPIRVATVNDNQSVRIASYDDGPFSFFVHFISNDTEYQQFQCDLQKETNSLVPLRFVPAAGTNCLALIKGHLYRAEIVHTGSNKLGSNTTIQMLESGQKSMVDVSQLFKMPVGVSVVKPFAHQFKLAAFERGTVAHLLKTEIEFLFNHFTSRKLLKLKAVPGHGKINQCSS